MRHVSLTSFIDYVLKAGTPKKTAAKKIHREIESPYRPLEDYYKQLKDALAVGLSKGDLSKELEVTCASVSANKKANYQALKNGILAAVKPKYYSDSGYFVPRKLKYKNGNIEISLNPEIGLRIKEKPTVVKLYTKSEKLSTDRIGTLLCMMREAYPKAYQVAILDCRNGKIYEYQDKMGELNDLLKAEITSLTTFLDGFDKFGVS